MEHVTNPADQWNELKERCAKLCDVEAERLQTDADGFEAEGLYAIADECAGRAATARDCANLIRKGAEHGTSKEVEGRGVPDHQHER